MVRTLFSPCIAHYVNIFKKKNVCCIFVCCLLFWFGNHVLKGTLFEIIHRKLSSRTSSVRSNLFPGCSQPPLTQPANPGRPTKGDSTSSENEDNGVSGNGTAVKSQTLQVCWDICTCVRLERPIFFFFFFEVGVCAH